MSGSVADSVDLRDGFMAGIWRPGIIGVVVFLVLAVVGFVVNRVYPAGIVMDLIGADDRGFVDVYLEFFIEPAVRCGIALVAGFLFPRGFFLWGLALVIHTPLSQILLTNQMIDAGYEPFVGGTTGMLNYLFVSMLLAALLMLVYTCFSALGMSVRYLASKRRRARSGTPTM